MRKLCLILFFFGVAWNSDAQYVYSSQFGSFGAGNGQFQGVLGIAQDYQGNLYVADGGDGGNDRIQVFDPDGNFINKWGSTGTGNSQFNNPCAIAIDYLTNSVYVADAGNSRIQKFAGDIGAFTTKWGSYGTGTNQFGFPIAIAVGANGNAVYVVDYNNNRVQKFTNTGTFITQWSSLGVAGLGSLTNPVAIAIDLSDNVYVLDGTSKNRVVKFTSAGTYVTHWTASGSGLAVDGSGNVYVTGGSTVKKFNPTGTLLAQFGAAGSGDGQFNGAYAATVTPFYDVLICDLGNDRIQRFSPVPIMGVARSAVNISNGGSYSFGDIARFTNSGSLTFTIKNTGLPVTELALTGTPLISVTGTHASDFVVNTSGLSLPVFGADETDFTINFSPGAIGLRTATVSIANNDPARNPYTFTVSGTGVKNGQTITFNPPSSAGVGTTIDLGATASSGLPVTYTVTSGSGSVNLNGSQLTINDISSGTVDIRVNQSGNADYVAAPFVERTITLVKGQQTISFTQPETKTFGNASFALTASSSAGLPVSFSSSNPSVATVTGSAVTIVGVGTTTITASQAGNANYNAATNVQRTLTVNKATPSVAITSSSSGVYSGTINLSTDKGGSSGAVTYTVTDNFNGTTGSATVNNSTGVLTLTGAGQVRVTATVASTTNHNQATALQVITINKADPVLSFTSGSTGVYGTDAIVTVDKGGSTGIVTFSVTNGTGQALFNGNVLSLEKAGTVTIKADMAEDNNYNSASTGDIPYTISKADPVLTITSANTGVYGTLVPLTGTTGGSTGAKQFLVLEDTGNGMVVSEPGTGAPLLQITRAGAMGVVLSVAADENYNEAQITEVFTASKRTVTLSGLAVNNKVYDGNTTATLSGVATLNGVLSGDVVAVSGTGAGTFADRHAGNNKGVSVTGFGLSGAQSSNYILDALSLNGVITPKPTEIVAVAISDKVYDGTTSGSILGTPMLDGVVGGDVVSVSGTGICTFLSKDVGTNVQASISGYSLSGAHAGNYTLLPTTLMANIVPKPIVVTAANSSKVYGDVDPTFTFSNSPDLLSGDTFTGSLSRNAGENAATYTITQGSLSAGDNYSLSFTSGQLIIEKAPLVAVADNVSCRVGEPLPALTISYQGFRNGDTSSAITEPVASTTATEASPFGTYPIQLAGGDASNYILTLTNGTLTIMPPIATIQIASASVVYDGTAKSVTVTTIPPALSVSVTYHLDGEEVPAPTNAGTYEVLAAITDPNFDGSASGTLTITKADQTITFANISDKTLGDAAFSLVATSSSSLDVVYSAAPPDRVVIDGNQIMLVSAGRVSITASQSGNVNYNAAADITRTFCINPPKPFITASFANSEAPVLTSSNPSGNQWYLGGAVISGAAGEAITVSQAGVYNVQTTVDDCASELSDDFPVIVTAISSPGATEVRAYPNPANDYLLIQGVTGVKEGTIQNAAGVAQRFGSENRDGTCVVDVRTLASGNYLLRMKSHEGVVTIRFIKK